MKDWLTASEIAELGLAGLPGTKRGVQKWFDRQGWLDDGRRARERKGQGGGVEYRVSGLPELARLDYAKRFVTEAASDARGTCTELSAPGSVVDGVAGEERDARLQVVATADSFRRKAQMSSTAADELFVMLYNRGDVDVSSWVRDRVDRLSVRSLKRWRAAVRRQETETLASDRSQARKGTSIMDRAFNGAIKETCLAMLVRNSHFKAHHIRDYLLDTFGERWEVIDAQGRTRTVDVPSERTVQNTLKRWKVDHADVIKRLSDPDGFRSSHQYAVKGSRGAQRLNQRWEIDASPADVMVTDGGRNGGPGRVHLYACVDVFSRRVVFTVCKNPNAGDLGLLIRKAIRRWGVPEAIHSDNGADFTAKFIERFLDNIGVEHELSRPFQPHEKPHVERVFKSLQHDLTVTLPGFVGHSVADRKVIEGRKAFSARLGEAPDALAQATLSMRELEDRVDGWVEAYEHSPHGGLRDRTPFEVAASAPGTLKTIDDDAALRMLLAPVPGGDGTRVVSKNGIRLRGVDYYCVDVMPGDKVFVREDPEDAGRLWLYSQDGLTYLGEAVSPDLLGIDRAELAAQLKAAQSAYIVERQAPIKEEAKRIKDPLAVADAISRQRAREAAERSGNLLAFPRPEQPHSTPALEAAAAVERSKTPEPSELPADAAALHEQLKRDHAKQRAIMTGEVVPVKVTPIRTEDERSRFRRALQLRARVDAGHQLKNEDSMWLARYEDGPEYRAMAKMAEDFPDQFGISS